MWQQRWKRVGGDSDSDSNGRTDWGANRGYNSRGLHYEPSPPLPRGTPPAPTPRTHTPYYIYDNNNARPSWYGVVPHQGVFHNHMATRLGPTYKTRSLPDSASDFDDYTAYKGSRSPVNWRIVALIVITIIILIAGVTVAVYFGTKSSSNDQTDTTTTTPTPDTTTPLEDVSETVVVSGDLIMHSLFYTEDLANPLSDAFQTLAQELCVEFESLFSTSSNLTDETFEDCEVIGFSNGSVIGHYKVNMTHQGNSANAPGNGVSSAARSQNRFTDSLKDAVEEAKAFNGKGVIPDEVETEIVVAPTTVDNSNVDGSGDGETDDLEDNLLFPA